MWKVNPRYLCRKHLLGEHLEMHMFLGVIRTGNSLRGYIKNGLVEIHNIIKRHNELKAEMIRRGYNHKSNIPKSAEKLLWIEGKVDIKGNEIELKRRCKNWGNYETTYRNKN